MADLREFHGPNAGYVLEQYEQYLRDPQSVDDHWRGFFAGLRPEEVAAALAGPAAAAPSGATAAAAPAVDVSKLVAAREMSRTIRTRGLTAARLDPLGTPPEADPALSLETYGLSDGDLERLPAAVVLGHDPGSANLAAEVRRLRGIYSGTTGYDYHHIPSARERQWLRQAIESARYARPLEPAQRRALLERLSQVEGFERYLHRTFFGQKRFSIEGTDTMVPMLDEVVKLAAGRGAAEVIIGMAHRGRLNVLTHVLGKPYPLMLAGFASAQRPPDDAAQQNTDEPSGDVKYHMGWHEEKEVDGRTIRVTLSPNPSHLEFVNPVVVGMTRASQDDTTHPGAPTLDPTRAVAVLIHGDAAFPGQGTVAETLNMSALRGYAVGGTLHVIANNQIGFTTDPSDDRSTRWASDLAKGFEIPIVHVNADDPEACLAAMRLAFAYREEFGKDFLVDLVGYRRWGHNEGDEPLFTQPVMYDAIKRHPTVREQYAKVLADAGVVPADEADAMVKSVTDALARALQAGGGGHRHEEEDDESRRRADAASGIRTSVDAGRLRELNAALTTFPADFTPNARLEKNVLQKRRDALDSTEPAIDWGQAEALAFASLLADGVPIRLTGQDAERGTFSHRHAVLNDARTGRKIDPLQTLPQATASFEVYNSPLSEMAVVGFEYGYSVRDPQALVLWEAQFGDFANGAQVMVDQYLSAAHQKWQQTSGLMLLLPHGYEGQGPEHSSARLERYLQLCAQDNLRVAYPTTSAQYFHLLRRQAALLSREPRPLVVMSPKSLLRHPLAGATLADLAEGGFHPVLADQPFGGTPDEVTRLILCSGKVYVDLTGTGDEQRAERLSIEGVDRVAVARVEELYPFPADELRETLARYPGVREVLWVQEEPRNMGAWTFVEPRLRALLGELPLRYEGRPERASPAEGYAHRHTAEQMRIVRAALTGAPVEAEGLISKRK